MYNHFNTCNIPIYFCNIRMKHLQHTSKTSETLETYACNMCFQRNISLLLGRMEARRRVEFTGGGGGSTVRRGGSGRTTRRGQPSAVTLSAPRRAPRLAGTTAKRYASEVVARRA